MAKTTDQITVDPQGQSMVVDIFDSNGVSITCYTARGGGSAFTLPVTISTATAFYLTSGGYYSVSAKVGGVEIAGVAGGRATVQAAQGVPVTVTPVLDQVEEIVRAGTAASSVAWQTAITANTTATKSNGYPADCTGGAISLTLPASPATGDQVGFYKTDTSANVLTVVGTVDGQTNAVVSTQYSGATVTYVGGTTGWKVTDVYTVTGPAGATGATGPQGTPGPLLTGKISGQYYTQSVTANVGSGNLITPVGAAIAVPIILQAGVTLDRIGVTHGTLPTAGETMRLGIYADNGNIYPGARLLDAGTVDLSTAAAFKTLTISQAIATSGMYWLVAVRQGGSATATVLSTSVAGSGAPTGSFMLPATADISARGAGFVATGVTAALPTPWTSTVSALTYQNATVTVMPWIAVRMV